MADDVVASIGTQDGAKFATDDDGTRHWPYSKQAWGADNTQTPVAAGAAAMPIQDGGNTITVDGTVAVTGVATAANQASEITLLAGGLPAALAAGGGMKVEGVAGGVAVPVSLATVPSHAVTNAGTFAVQDATAQASLSVMDDWDNAASDGASVSGDVAHDTADAGEPVKIGARALAHGANPTAVAADDRTNLYANRAGVLFTIGGHPNAKSAVYNWTGSTTDDNVLAAIAGGTKYAITRITFTLDEACTVGVAVRLGFGTANVPALGAANADAVDDVIFYHPGMVPGTSYTIGDGSGILGVGGDGAELRLTAEAATGGTGGLVVTYYTIES